MNVFIKRVINIINCLLLWARLCKPNINSLRLKRARACVYTERYYLVVVGAVGRRDVWRVHILHCTRGVNKTRLVVRARKILNTAFHLPIGFFLYNACRCPPMSANRKRTSSHVNMSKRTTVFARVFNAVANVSSLFF